MLSSNNSFEREYAGDGINLDHLMIMDASNPDHLDPNNGARNHGGQLTFGQGNKPPLPDAASTPVRTQN